MSLRARLVALLSLVGAAIVTVMLLLVSARVKELFAEAAGREALSARRLVDQSFARRLETYRAMAEVVANETIVKEALLRSSNELAFTYADSAHDKVRTQYVLVLDRDGRVVADAAQRIAPGTRLGTLGVGVSGASFIDIDGTLAAVGVAPVVMQGERPLGVVVLGDPLASQQALVGDPSSEAGVTILDARGGPLVSSVAPDRANAVARTDRECTLGSTPREMVLGGEPHLLVDEPIRNPEGDRLGCVVVTRSIAAQLDALTSTQRWLALVGAAITIAAVLGGALLAYRVAEPIERLTRAADRVAAGDLDPPELPARGTDEVGRMARAFDGMLRGLRRQGEIQRHLAARESELALARRVQTSILPRHVAVRGLEVGARMVPASEVGGDYYDVIACADGCWVAIGDVTGHGMNAGLLMLMLQSAVGALARAAPEAAPSDHLGVLNSLLYDNIRNRLGVDDHVTFSLLRYRLEGTVTVTGAHEDLLVWRAAARRCEWLPTRGPWLGAKLSVERFASNDEVQLHAGDLLVLYTDGITEARNASGEQFGPERLAARIEHLHDAPATDICDAVLAAARDWAPTQSDDMAVMVLRYRGDDPPA
jgi:sigma-B regulation protein RsbU (phosphoserine phosphatase)